MSATPSQISASAICRTSLTRQSADETCVHRAHFYCYLFTETFSYRRSFFDWATPVKLCSSVFCMLIDCLLHQFLCSIQERVCVPHRMHVVNELQPQVVHIDVSTRVFACRLSRLLRAGLTIFVKRRCTISWTSFTSSAPTPRSCMILSKSARESPYVTSRQASAAKLHWACV